MFILNQTNTYTWPVKLSVATDGGRFTEATFDAKFNRLPASRIEELRALIPTPEYSAIATARELVCGWSGIQDTNGDIPFSDEALSSLLEVPGAAPAIVVAFFESASGVVRKN